MKNNIGTVDKIVRILIAAVIVILYSADVVTGIPGIVLLVIPGIFIVTSIIGFCPIYQPMKINTTGQNNKPDQENPDSGFNF